MALLPRVRAAVVLTTLLSSMVAVCMVAIIPLLPLLLLRSTYPAYRRATAAIVGTWEVWAAFLLEKGYGIRIALSGDDFGDALQQGGGIVLLSNHPTRLDWAMLWMVLSRFRGVVPALHIMLKSGLKSYPFLGWATSAARYLFLKRAWAEDEAHLTSMLVHIAREPYAVLIFPEGTDFNPNGRAASNKFAAKAGLPCYERVLHPRTRGLVHTLAVLRDGARRPVPLAALLDLTIAYEGAVPQSEAALAAGRMPAALHCHVRHFPAAALPTEPQQLDEWVQAAFRRKEAALKAFVAAGAWDLAAAVAAADGDGRGKAAADGDGQQRPPAALSPLSRTPIAAYARAVCIVAPLLCLAGAAAWHWPLLALVYVTGTAAVFAALNRWAGGLDALELRLHRAVPISKPE